MKTIVVVHTAHSIYEIDGLYVRRVFGLNEPMPYQGPDGVWKETVSIVELNLHGERTYIFNWGQGKVTWTSVVVEEELRDIETSTPTVEPTQ